MMKTIDIKNVHKFYGKQEILHGLSLSVEEGSIHGLVGRNGCGKTTLIKCMTGIYQTDAGEIQIFGKPVYEKSRGKSSDWLCSRQ